MKRMPLPDGRGSDQHGGNVDAACRLILASASPRRRELLATLLPVFDVVPSPLAEPAEPPRRCGPETWAAELAEFKAGAVAAGAPGRWVLGADTLVVCGEQWLGKPADLADAWRMLRIQAGCPTDVITGLCLLRRGVLTSRFRHVETTRVWMRADVEAIEAYLATGEWAGKAGAYGIQDVGDRLVARVAGSFSNVVGLPLSALRRLLERVPELRPQLRPAAA